CDQGLQGPGWRLVIRRTWRKNRQVKNLLSFWCHMCHTDRMTPFHIKLESGQSIFDQVVFAATRAILAGAMKPGDPFPSVRALAKDLKIHPNTAHKVIQHLIQERW